MARRLAIVIACIGIFGWAMSGGPTTGAQKLPTLTNSIGMKLVTIPAGKFVLGSATGGDFDERPTRLVTFSQSFLMGVTEVTNAQYEQFDPAHKALRGKYGFSKDDDEPVVFVSWHDAVKFCKWLSEKEGKPYRLPTEAEWEYACRAGTAGPFHTGKNLEEAYLRYQKIEWEPRPVKLTVGTTPGNAWGLKEMHGNVEEWCQDWYGPYEAGEATDPVGRASGDARVTRGGSHGTPVEYLRSANRSGTLPEDKHWFIGFRVVQGQAIQSAPLPAAPAGAWSAGVSQEKHDWKTAHDPDKPYFSGPSVYVKIPAGSEGPLFSRHNHQPAVTACPNGDLLAIWYSTRAERGRELGVAAARLRRGATEWEPASPFWDMPDRNDHGSSLLWDGDKTLFHFNGLGSEATWAKLALVMRTSVDNGATWSAARLIHAEHDLHQQVIEGSLRTREGHLIVPCDAVPGGEGGTAIHISKDGGRTWSDPAAGKAQPVFGDGRTGGWIAGIHAGVAQLKDGSLMALGRGDSIGGKMPRSISSDWGGTWTYSSSGLPPLGSGQRLVLRRLKEGPLFLASFDTALQITDAAGVKRTVSGLFAALSFDEGLTWPVRRLVTDDGPARQVDGGGNTKMFTLSPDSAEPRGYLTGTQTPDGMIHLLSSKNHYRFNVAWIKAPMSAR